MARVFPAHDTYSAAIDAAAASLAERFGAMPTTAVVLGSGLGAFATKLADAQSADYADIPGWPVPSVIGHEGRLVIGRLHAARLAVLAGRVHFYEGRSLDDVTFGVRVLGRLGVRRLVLTNAAGGVNTRFRAGALMLIDDHINLLGANPLSGPNRAADGPRFPDMSAVYDPGLREIALAAARDRRIELERGIYVAVSGPSYETPAEIRAFRTLGGDAVGMSTVPEAIVARYLGMSVLGLSCISNHAAGMRPGSITPDEVLATTARVSGQFQSLMEGLIERLGD